jgi:hypothetical protein
MRHELYSQWCLEPHIRLTAPCITRGVSGDVGANISEKLKKQRELKGMLKW